MWTACAARRGNVEQEWIMNEQTPTMLTYGYRPSKRLLSREV